MDPIALGETYIHYARLINLVLLIGIIVVMSGLYIIRREHMARRSRRLWMWVYLIFVNLAYATADNLLDNIRVNPPVIVAMFLFSGLLLSLLWRPEDDDEVPAHDNAVPKRLILWLDRKVVAHKYRMKQ